MSQESSGQQGNYSSNAGGGSDGGATTEGGAEGIDSLRRALGETEQRFTKTSRELNEVKSRADKSDKTLEALRKALGHEEPKPKKATWKERGGELADFYLQKHLEAERSGHGGLPLTATLATTLTEYMEDNETRFDEAMRTIRQLEDTVRKLSDPTMRQADNAYAKMDGHIIEHIESLYGPGDDNFEIKSAQYDSIVKLMNKEITKLQREHPDLWEQIMRSDDKQRRLVRHVMERNLPPRARQILEEDMIKNSPMTMNDLWDAFREAGNIEDPTERNRIRTAIRQDIWQQQTLPQRSRGR